MSEVHYSHHLNNGVCPKCVSLMDKYPGFNHDLRSWFVLFQAVHPEGHISCAGRGKIDQELAYAKKTSKAHWGESSHNFNCAIDIFCIIQNRTIYDQVWFNAVLGPEIPDHLTWYGRPGSPFFELPHIEIKNWKELVMNGIALLVEE